MLAHLDESEADHGPRSVAAETTRLCVATRAVKPIEDMIRFVRGPDGAVVPDLKRKLPGRGVWVTAQRVALAQAINRGAFRRGLKSEVAVSENLLVLVEQLLERSVLDALAIARKAGDVVTGFVAVADAIQTKPVIALLHAQDAAVEGRRKLASMLQRRDTQDAKGIVTITAFTSAQLDLALSRSNVVHAALLAGRTSDSVIARWRVLDRFGMGEPDGEFTPMQHDRDAQSRDLDD
jgi:predicted RNA-binding protein YlxR (DUF448 family)